MKIDTAQLPVFCLVVDTQCRIIEWNTVAATITGLARKNVLGKDVGDCLSTITTPNKADACRKAKGIKSIVIEVFQTTVCTIHEILVPTVGEGDHILLMLNISLLNDENGSLLGAVIVGQDIKEHKRLDKNQMTDGDSVRYFFEKTNTLIIGMDSSGLINSWNIKMMEVTGFSKEESVGKNFLQVLTI